jgi:hypothetical protein
VGAFYNRIGYLVADHLLGKSDRVLLDTMAGPAIAVWRKIELLVLEARLLENSTIFQDFERMLRSATSVMCPTRPCRSTSWKGRWKRNAWHEDKGNAHSQASLSQRR